MTIAEDWDFSYQAEGGYFVIESYKGRWYFGTSGMRYSLTHSELVMLRDLLDGAIKAKEERT